MFTLLFSYPLFYQEFNIDLYREYFVNTMANDTALIDTTYALMVPEPHGPEVQQMDTTQFFQIPMPKAFVTLTKDATLSANYKSWLLFSDRIKKGNNAGVPYQVSNRYQPTCVAQYASPSLTPHRWSNIWVYSLSLQGRYLHMLTLHGRH